MGEAPRPLIKRDAQRKLSLAIGFFLAIPAFVLGYATIVASIAQVLPADCLREDCPTTRTFTAPPFAAPAATALVVLIVAALALYWMTYRRDRAAWWIVLVLGVGLVGAAVLADVATRAWEVALITFVWPMAPGLMAIDAARRGRRSPGAS